uniref:Uncharacterized protein n=1 Tax=Setaria italica TaxID=4555 RepID=K3XTY7_SETIT
MDSVNISSKNSMSKHPFFDHPTVSQKNGQITVVKQHPERNGGGH